MEKIGIVLCTYKRKDGTTLTYLKRALDSIQKQKYQNFKVFLMGDRYEDLAEFDSFSSGFNEKNMYAKNLPVAHERDFYGNHKKALWSYAGTYATNYAIDLCVSSGINYVSFINHDDWWYPNHLEEIHNCIKSKKADFICTVSTYLSEKNLLPAVESTDHYLEFLPKSSKLIHSSVCLNFKTIPLRHIDVFKETGKVGLPGDADLWERCRKHIISNNLKSILINRLTCRHDEEGFEKK